MKFLSFVGDTMSGKSLRMLRLKSLYGGARSFVLLILVAVFVATVVIVGKAVFVAVGSTVGVVSAE